MIKRTHTPVAAINYKMKTMMRIFLHCVISAITVFLCICVNVNGEAAQLIEKVENKTNDYKANPLQIIVKDNSTEAANPFVQPFTEENIPNGSTNSSRNKLRNLSLDGHRNSKVQYKRRRKPYRRRRKIKRKKLSRNNLRFIQRYQDIQNNIDILNSYPNYRRG